LANLSVFPYFEEILHVENRMDGLIIDNERFFKAVNVVEITFDQIDSFEQNKDKQMKSPFHQSQHQIIENKARVRNFSSDFMKKHTQ
jgi:hypothetical protein